jgi:hypothetical protein
VHAIGHMETWIMADAETVQRRYGFTG